ncbi:MAG: mercury methylation ferredoxin HgcB [Pelolinea sp.]|nr:mercury methylation ferredoxin HgcB [Pelolinea sp.]
MLNAYLENTLAYNSSLCNGCGLCVTVCPHGVFEMDGRHAKLVDSHACMECGACQKNCITRAITVDSGVGCASAMIQAALKGQKEPTCAGEDT